MRRTEIPCELLAQLYAAGVSAPALACQFECSTGTIYSRMQECGIPTRSIKEAALLDRGKGLDCKQLHILYMTQQKSLSQIAETYHCSPATVSRWLKKCGIVTRPVGGDVFQYPKMDFSGDWAEKAYLLGFRAGDLHVERGARAIRVRCTSTRPEQIRLVEKLFTPYGGIWKSMDREKRGVGVTAHLNLSFDFLGFA